MKKIILLICGLLITTEVLAKEKPSNIKCYSGGKLIYSTNIDELMWEYPFVAFVDKKTKKYIAIKGECVIQLN